MRLRGLAYRLFKPIFELFLDEYYHRALHPKLPLLLQAQKEASEYIAVNMPGALNFSRLSDFHRFALSKVEVPGLYLEFGVGSGSSINQFAEMTQETVHGFDSFLGLPEDWPGRHEPRGAYSLGGKLPKVRSNVELHRGWFNETLRGFLDKTPGKVAFLHMDADLYSSTHYVLEALQERLQKGSVIVFDEYFNYISWRDHEYKAFQEFVSKRKIAYTYLAYAYQQVVLKIEGSDSIC